MRKDFLGDWLWYQGTPGSLYLTEALTSSHDFPSPFMRGNSTLLYLSSKELGWAKPSPNP